MQNNVTMFLMIVVAIVAALWIYDKMQEAKAKREQEQTNAQINALLGQLMPPTVPAAPQTV